MASNLNNLSVNEFTKYYGVTDVQNLYDACLQAVSVVKGVCLPIVGLAFLFLFLIQMTKWASGEHTIDWTGFGRFILLSLLLVNYEEVLTQINSLIAYFSNSIGPGLGNYSSGLSLTEKVNQLLERTRSKPDYSLWTDGLNNIFDWIVSNATHMIIILSRAVIYCIREIYMMFLMAVGPIALLLSLFPFFENTAVHWLRTYLTAGMWAFSMGILDLLLNSYLDRMLATNNDNGLVIMNIGIMLMYLSVPYITSKYMGGLQSQLMRRFSNTGPSTFKQVGNLMGGASEGAKAMVFGNNTPTTIDIESHLAQMAASAKANGMAVGPSSQSQFYANLQGTTIPKRSNSEES